MTRGARREPDKRAAAVVIGASMAGLAAAAALAGHYDRVTILDRDTLPDSPQPRRGVPQGRHAHGLQPGGMRALDDLLPGLMTELTAAGAPTGDISNSCTWVVGGNRFARAETGVLGIGLTRPFLEHHVRARVAALPGVTIRDRVEIRGLITDGSHRVAGVEVAAVDGGAPVRMAADLVVDASGKVSRLPQWLGELGYPAPDEEAVHCRMGYLTARWRLSPEHRPDDVVMIATPAANPHFGVLIAQEDGTHIITLGGLLNTAPSRDDYLAFAGRLPDAGIADALVDAEPVTDLQPSHFPASRRRRYDRLRSFPPGLLALGDSIASFNPMYGQGMTVAALEAVALRDMLARGPVDAHTFFARAHRIEDVAWKIATGGDLRFEAVEGRRTSDGALMNRYLDRLTAAARTDPVLARQFLLVASFVERPESFFRPAVLWRVLVGGRKAARDAAPAVAAPDRPSPAVPQPDPVRSAGVGRH
jgi:2-polyprenyl-6-methoxyphenol hydroxylase-like FAD-dependent oxidoreductase